MILLTGGSGKLGTELQKHLEYVFAPSHERFDILKEYEDGSDAIGDEAGIDMVIHSAAYTNVKEAENNKEKCYEINVQGTINVLNMLAPKPFVYISSEYAFNPVNYYAQTKVAAEAAVRSVDWPTLIIRTLFKPRPYPHEYAYVDQLTRGDYVDTIAKIIADEIKKWDRKESKVLHVGTERKSMYQLAEMTKPGVKPNSVDDVVDYRVPKDYRYE